MSYLRARRRGDQSVGGGGGGEGTDGQVRGAGRPIYNNNNNNNNVLSLLQRLR